MLLTPNPLLSRVSLQKKNDLLKIGFTCEFWNGCHCFDPDYPAKLFGPRMSGIVFGHHLPPSSPVKLNFLGTISASRWIFLASGVTFVDPG